MILMSSIFYSIFAFFQVIVRVKLRDKLKLIVYMITSLLLPFSIRIRYHLLEIVYMKIMKKVVGQLSLDGLPVLIDNITYSLVDLESLAIVLSGTESYVYRYFKIKKGDVFIDVGAHVGKYSLYAASIVGNEGLVISLEPNEINYRNLLKGIEINDFINIIAINIAAWCSNKNLKIYFGDVAGHHTAKTNTGLGYFIIKAKTLNIIVDDLNIKHIDWIKIDVEGAEFEVLKGSIDIINKFKPKIIIEVFPENFEKIYNLLKRNNYLLTQISPTQIKNLSYYIAEPITRSINIT